MGGRLAQLSLERFDLRSEFRHLLCLRCDGLGLFRDKVLDGADFSLDGVS